MNEPTIKQRFSEFIGLNEEDISDRYFSLLIVVIVCFLLTQIVYVSFLSPNWLNVWITVMSLLLFLLLFFVIKNKKIRHIIKPIFIVIIHIILFFFWISSEGLLGSISSLISICIFIVAIITPLSYNKWALLLSFVFYMLMINVEFVFPEIIIPYSSLFTKKLDIIIGTAFTSLVVGTSFYYLRVEYEKKVEEVKAQFEEQKRLNEELDNFVYRTSHDLRAPISSSLGLIDLINTTDNEVEKSHYLALQKKSLLKMDQFIQEILNYSRNSRLELSLHPINFNGMIKEAIHQVEFANPKLSLTVNTQIEENVSFISDTIRLQIIFNNIISNAFRYCDVKKEKPFLNITVTKQTDYIQIVFQDNGQGIHANSIPKVFDMFYRANAKSEGSGVGLYIVKQSVEKLQGTITCTSTLGEGTRFEIILPNVLT